MQKVKDYRYLGEYINDKGTDMTTVEKRIAQSLTLINEILAVANSTETQHQRIEIGIKLAHACLDSKLLYNAETWLHLNKNDIKNLEKYKTISIKGY